MQKFFLGIAFSLTLCFCGLYFIFGDQLFNRAVSDRLWDRFQPKEKVIHRVPDEQRKGIYRPQKLERKTTPYQPRKKAERKVYSWVDKNGVPNFSDTPPTDSSVEYKIAKAISSANKRVVTSVIIDGNSILVPVKLSYKGRVKSTWLILDTGATHTSIHRAFAQKMRLYGSVPIKVRVADGSTVYCMREKIDYIQVGPYRLKNFQVDIINFKGRSKIYQGLLGMDFLKSVDYKVDFNRSLIAWSKKR